MEVSKRKSELSALVREFLSPQDLLEFTTRLQKTFYLTDFSGGISFLLYNFCKSLLDYIY